MMKRLFARLMPAPGKRGARQCAIAYKRGTRVYLHASSKTTGGVWILQAPVLVADAADTALLGRHLAQVLDASREGVPHPDSFDGIFDPILSAAGVASWLEFTDGGLCVGISCENGHIAFVPTCNRGGTRGFDYLKDRQRGIDAAARGHYGAALVLSFEQSR